MNLSLSGKQALIAGSTRGIGLAIAQELALLGANCTLLARNEASLKEAVATLPVTAGQTHGFAVADFKQHAQVLRAVEGVVSSRPVHILINNTGGPAAGPIVEAASQQFADAFAQHILNFQSLAQQVLPGMKADGYGRIVNIVSTSVKIPIANLGVSNTIRAAMAGWAKTWAMEAGKFGITVNNILPGYTKTDRLESLVQANARQQGITEEEIKKSMIDKIPANRFGEAWEIAALAAFLASPAAAYINGTNIPVDGGSTGAF